MAPKEPTRAQLSSRLAYDAHKPAFLRRMQGKLAGDPPSSDEDGEFEDLAAGSGRPPIPRRPAPPERPADDPGSAGEDSADEAPQVVVLKAGKHLSAREAEDARRSAKGLPPLPDPDEVKGEEQEAAAESEAKKEKAERAEQGLNFSSAKGAGRARAKKRKAVGDGAEDGPADKPAKGKKKQKKAEKKLLSFGEDA